MNDTMIEGIVAGGLTLGLIFVSHLLGDPVPTWGAFVLYFSILKVVES